MQSSLPGRQCNHNGSNIALGLSEDKLPEKPFPVGHFLIWPIRVCPAEQGMFWDQFRFPGKLPTYPSPKPTLLSLSSHSGQNVGLGEGWVGASQKPKLIHGCQARQS